MTEKSTQLIAKEWHVHFPTIPLKVIEHVIEFSERERNTGYIYIFLKLLRNLDERV